jgi:hypothetical protein
MKVFIVFLGLLIINVSFITYHGDLNRYVQLQRYLKDLAEEGAAGVAMYYDEEAYGKGLMIINREEGEKYISFLLDKAEEKLGFLDIKDINGDIEIFDDGEGAGGPGATPRVTVILRLTVNDMFRLPFLNREQVVTGAQYELAHYPQGW